MLKIVQVVPAISEESSGPSYSVVRLSESVRDAGSDVTIISLDLAEMSDPPSLLHTFPLSCGPRRLGRSKAMKKWLCDSSIRSNIDIIHNHGMWQMNAIYPSIAARRGNIPLITSPRGAFSKWAMKHGSYAKRIFWPLLQRQAVEATSCFLATSEEEYEDIRRLGFKQPVAIIPNGIDIPDLLPKIFSNSKTLLYLGRLHPVKGLENLLQAWSHIETSYPSWQLHIAGSDGTYGSKVGYGMHLQQLANQLRLKRIHFLGELKGDNKWQAYRDASLFVLPTFSENFGIVIAEALATGTPAIVTQGAPWKGLIANKAGWYIEIGIKPLITCLDESLSSENNTLCEMGKSGRDWMLRDYSWDCIGVQMLEVYKWLVEPSKSIPVHVRMD